MPKSNTYGDYRDSTDPSKCCGEECPFRDAKMPCECGEEFWVSRWIRLVEVPMIHGIVRRFGNLIRRLVRRIAEKVHLPKWIRKRFLGWFAYDVQVSGTGTGDLHHKIVDGLFACEKCGVEFPVICDISAKSKGATDIRIRFGHYETVSFIQDVCKWPRPYLYIKRLIDKVMPPAYDFASNNCHKWSEQLYRYLTPTKRRVFVVDSPLGLFDMYYCTQVVTSQIKIDDTELLYEVMELQMRVIDRLWGTVLKRLQLYADPNKNPKQWDILDRLWMRICEAKKSEQRELSWWEKFQIVMSEQRRHVREWYSDIMGAKKGCYIRIEDAVWNHEKIYAYLFGCRGDIPDASARVIRLCLADGLPAPYDSEGRGPYETLELSRLASQDEIRQAYRQLARKHHPDLNPSDRRECERKMTEINRAYSVLVDDRKLGPLCDKRPPVRCSDDPITLLQLYSRHKEQLLDSQHAVERNPLNLAYDDFPMTIDLYNDVYYVFSAKLRLYSSVEEARPRICDNCIVDSQLKVGPEKFARECICRRPFALPHLDLSSFSTQDR